jgi:peptidyl-prolyl cis-trans isomerase SurA
MKRALLILAAAALALFAPARATEILDGVAAIVNDRIITYSEVRQYVQPVVQQLRRNYSGPELIERIRAAQLDALDTLIERALIIQEFHEKGFKLPETYVDQQINDIIANEFGGDRAAFIRTLQAQNMTLSQYREQIRDRIIVQAMRGRKTQQYVVVSPYKIEQYYKENADQFKVDDKIKLRMIFIKKLPAEPVSPEASPYAPATADPRRKLAEEILAQLDAGDSFESLARVYSEGKEAREGGDWGWIGRDVLRKELNEVAFSLQPGQHSRIIETPEGYYILYVEDLKPAHVRPLAEVRDEIEKILLQQQRAKLQQDWIKELRAKAYIRLF